MLIIVTDYPRYYEKLLTTRVIKKSYGLPALSRHYSITFRHTLTYLNVCKPHTLTCLKYATAWEKYLTLARAWEKYATA